jgi:hypothetical protein
MEGYITDYCNFRCVDQIDEPLQKTEIVSLQAWVRGFLTRKRVFVQKKYKNKNVVESE